YVHGAVHVAARDDHRVRAHLDEFARGRFHVRQVFDGQPRQNLGLGDVWRDHAHAFEQFGRDKLDPGGIEKLGAGRGFEDRVQHHVGEFVGVEELDRKSTRLNSSHQIISYAVFCLKKKIKDADSENTLENHVRIDAAIVK